MGRHREGPAGCDGELAQLVTALRRRARPAGAVLATVRTGARAPDAITARWKDRHLRRVDLAVLDAVATRELVEGALGGQVESHAAVRLAGTRSELVALVAR